MKYQIIWLVIIYAILSLAQICSADELDQERIIRRVAIEEHFDPNLAVAIATVESGLDPSVVGTQGEIGVYQLKPNYHPVVNGLDTLTNARVAIRYLKTIKQRFEAEYGDAWVIFYNLGPFYKKPIRYPRLFPYYVKINQARLHVASL